MRNIDEVRDAKLEAANSLVSRPNMWAIDGYAMGALAHGVLADLCFIDDRDDEAAEIKDHLHYYGKVGVAGAFEAVFGEEGRYVAEVASVFAEKLHALGYIKIERLLSEFEWTSLIATVRERYEEIDVRQSEVVAELGEPSLVVGRSVVCYVGEAENDWVFFDFWEKDVVVYEPDQGGFRVSDSNKDPLLRNLRVPAATFDESLILTRYGKVLRWGPGWWLTHEPVRGSSTPPGIREQLQDIKDGDPSQSLGLRRP